MNEQTEQIRRQDVFGATLTTPSKLTLVDWICIAKALEFERSWGFYRWQENTEVDFGSLSLSDWEGISELLGNTDVWAYYRWKEYTA